jgi:hypothetical protein
MAAVELPVPVPQAPDDPLAAFSETGTIADASPPPPKLDYTQQRVKTPTSVIERLAPTPPPEAQPLPRPPSDEGASPRSTRGASSIEKMLPAKTLMGIAPPSEPRQEQATTPPPIATPVAEAKPPTINRPAIADLSRAIDLDPQLDLDAIGREWPELLPPLKSGSLDEDLAQALLVYEREIATVDDTAATAALRNEAGRLSERLGDLDRARSH